jgi:hypothetical protein
VQLPALTVFQLWAPLVARLSFLLSRFVADGTERREQEVPASRIDIRRASTPIGQTGPGPSRHFEPTRFVASS